MIPPALQNIVKYDGHYVAAPFNMHSTNWVWVNKALFDQVGGPEPKTFEDFVALAEKFKEAGLTPVAHGGHFVARHEGRVLFVRHAAPGERVVVNVTEGAEDEAAGDGEDALDVVGGCV